MYLKMLVISQSQLNCSIYIRISGPPQESRNTFSALIYCISYGHWQVEVSTQHTSNTHTKKNQHKILFKLQFLIFCLSSLENMKKCYLVLLPTPNQIIVVKKFVKTFLDNFVGTIQQGHKFIEWYNHKLLNGIKLQRRKKKANMMLHSSSQAALK